ncbi:TonB family protein [Bradyrhizobium sp. CCGUVB14]|uniref:TonB family protein n=1 Tax=Bradyrhizobium sp. CCGUVB14 TaxID=2949628 RepID=UPI0020B2B46A|nr:TonB family protein [Bradyrhizobium sp. CCGUVB14]MCP3447768.1 TonB family protein [Bradyrhizobium sp. CCGUVB14]
MQMKFPLTAALLGLLLAFPALAQTDTPTENVKAWRARIAAHINSNKYFPGGGLGQTGKAKVTFAIDRSGKLISRALTESTGSRALDDAALAIIARAEPYPAPPPELKDDSFSFTVPMNFAGRQFQVPPFGLVLSRPDPTLGESDPMAVWHKAVTEHVWRNRSFPPEAMGQKADAGVTFVIDRAGKLISNALVESTGSPPLDAAALKMVERSEPFPRPPPEAKDDLQRMTILMTLDGTHPVDGAWADEAKLKAKLNSVCRGC